LHPLSVGLYNTTLSALIAMVVIAIDDTAIVFLNIGAIAMVIILLQVVVLDAAISRLIIAIIVFDIHDNDLMIIPH
jgi:hypothetical protein